MKKIVLLSLGIFLFAVALPKEVSQKTAAGLALKVYYHRINKYYREVDFDALHIRDVFTVQENSVNLYYVFNIEDYGFIIISAEDKMVPVLGYTFDYQYNPDDISPNFRSWMESRKASILFAKQASTPVSQKITEKWDEIDRLDVNRKVEKSKNAVAPLLASTWDQGYPYNYDCPYGSGGPGGRVWAGCVATAYGQVMYYWRWPDSGTGSHCYTPSGYDEQCADFENTEYNWNGMLDHLDYKNASAPVAQLLHHAGIGVDMMYGPDGSGAYSDDVVYAMKNYFKYSDATEILYRYEYSDEEWINILKQQLDSGYPMYYAGCQGKGCHAFVLDGYTDEEEYHFNLGWGGAANGYYTIDNPAGFPVWQQVIINSIPNDEYPPYCSGTTVINDMKGIIEDGSGPLSDYLNNTNAGWCIDLSQSPQNVQNITLTFLDMDVAGDDFVKVYDGADAGATLLGSYNAGNFPETITSSGPRIFLQFESNEANTAGGFRIRYDANEPPAPGIITLTDYSGTIDDGSGDYNYQTSQTSLWTVDLPEAEKIYFNFTEFHTQDTFDIVRIIDAENNVYVAAFSGDYEEGNLPETVVVPSSKAYVLFKSDVLHTDSGWALEYSSQLVGTEENSRKESLKIYPNPVRDALHVEFEQPSVSDMSIEIRNAQSQLMYSSHSSGFYGNYRNSIRLADYPPGVYVVHIENANGSFNKKFIKI